MPRRTPDFWRYDADTPWPRLLQPLAALYELGNRLNRQMARPQPVARPVISIGNLVAGGAGKTPTAIALAEILNRLGLNPHIVCRGYGGRLTGPARVDHARHTAADVGDEALLLDAAAPTWIGRDRPAAAPAANAAGAGCIIADDAHQTYALERQISILVVDGGFGFGNGRLLPAGPLREPVAEGLTRCDAIVLVGKPTVPLPSFGSRPVFSAALEPNAADAVRLRGRHVLAFAGIGRPEKFFTSLQNLGAIIVKTVGFPDHAPYSEDTVMRLVEQAHALHAIPVTTAKDQMRLPKPARPMVDVLRVTLAFDDLSAVERFLKDRLSRVQPRRTS
jgi:tetraacyldisaccharide 4'-kinase